jgi:hypothetical protein
MQNIIQKSENAKFTTNKLDGVRKLLVVVKTYTTKPLPKNDKKPSINMKTIKILCQSGFNGGHWYLKKQIVEEMKSPVKKC